MSGTSGTVIDLSGEDATPSGQDRRRAIALAFAMCLAVGSAGVGRDGPIATAPLEAPRMLIISAPQVSDVAVFTFPDRLANEAMPQLSWQTVQVRGTEGLAIEGQGVGATSVVTWTEKGTVYRLSSDRRLLGQLIDLANTMR
jgi:hypothetical protein